MEGSRRRKVLNVQRKRIRKTPLPIFWKAKVQFVEIFFPSRYGHRSPWKEQRYFVSSLNGMCRNLLKETYAANNNSIRM